MKRFLSLLLCLLLCLCVIPLSGCLSPEEEEHSEALCREFMDYVILDHKKSAYNIGGFSFAKPYAPQKSLSISSLLTRDKSKEK